MASTFIEEYKKLRDSARRRADHLVTGGADLLILENVKEARFVTPWEIWTLITQE